MLTHAFSRLAPAIDIAIGCGGWGVTTRTCVRKAPQHACECPLWVEVCLPIRAPHNSRGKLSRAQLAPFLRRENQGPEPTDASVLVLVGLALDGQFWTRPPCSFLA